MESAEIAEIYPIFEHSFYLANKENIKPRILNNKKTDSIYENRFL